MLWCGLNPFSTLFSPNILNFSVIHSLLAISTSPLKEHEIPNTHTQTERTRQPRTLTQCVNQVNNKNFFNLPNYQGATGRLGAKLLIYFWSYSYMAVSKLIIISLKHTKNSIWLFPSHINKAMSKISAMYPMVGGGGRISEPWKGIIYLSNFSPIRKSPTYHWTSTRSLAGAIMMRRKEQENFTYRR